MISGWLAAPAALWLALALGAIHFVSSSEWPTSRGVALGDPKDGHELDKPRMGYENEQQKPIYTNQFVIQIRGGEQEARRLAERHGFNYLNHILGDYYHLEHRRLAKRSTSESELEHQDSSSALNISIQEEPQVLLVERQLLKKRVKRDYLQLEPIANQQSRRHIHRPANQPPVGRPPPRPAPQQTRPANNQQLLAKQQLQQQLRLRMQQQLTRAGSPRPGVPGHTHLHSDPMETGASGAIAQFQLANGTAASQLQLQKPPWISAPDNATLGTQSNGSLRDPRGPFDDPMWPHMWYLDGGAKNGFDLNVLAAWKMGYTGKGIVITILDDGLEKDHPDLATNYDHMASYDINGDDPDPMPRYDVSDSNRHGTRCAGEVAAVPHNNICTVGIAYNSKVGGVRMLDGDVTDAVEARSLGLNNQHIHIYSASWGPDDNGKTVDGPGEMATRAFIEGVTNGRQGLGSIFVFASGNGGREHDNCNCDGYTNSIWTLSISSATENGYVPWYIEFCSSTLATTYSSGSYEERQITTTDLHHSCTSSHTGTSASAPLAAGICALVLESNPRLSWRDMQHIVVRTAKPANLVAKDWRTNAMGRNVSHAFGYGLMDAAAMIHLARRWTSVPVQYTCEVRSPQMDKFIPSKGYIELKLRAECANVRHLEHVQSKVTLSATRRGDIHIYLVSPHGTRSTLLAQRPNDQAEQGFRNWPFMTVHSWGESPNGVWTLEVHNDGKPQSRAFLKEWTLILYGTYEDPNRHLDATPAAYPAKQPAVKPPSSRPTSEPTNQPSSTTPTTSTSTSTTSSTTTSTSTSTTTSTTTTTTTTSTTPAPPHRQPPASPDHEPPSNQSSGFRFGPHWSYVPPPVATPDGSAMGQPTRPQAPPFRAPPPPPTSTNHERRPDFETSSAGEPAITKPPVDQMGEPQAARPPQTTATPSGGELDGNQIDLKMTKDYRSSGGQSIYNSQQTMDLSVSQSPAGGNQSAEQPNDPSNQLAMDLTEQHAQGMDLSISPSSSSESSSSGSAVGSSGSSTLFHPASKLTLWLANNLALLLTLMLLAKQRI